MDGVSKHLFEQFGLGDREREGRGTLHTGLLSMG